MPWFPSSPTALPALAVVAIGLGGFTLALLAARRRRGPREAGGIRDRASWAGILVQMAGFAIVGMGPVVVALDPCGAPALTAAGVAAACMIAAIALFDASSRAMGRNWAIVALTRADHKLVTTGPFATMRNPIYVALFPVQIAIAVAWGHYWHLLAGVPLYWLGTMMRVRVEERLLRSQFGSDYDAYTAHVRRFGVI